MKLSTPLLFHNGRSAPNRVVLAAMTNQQSHEDGTLSEAELAWIASRADGGFGIITTCASHVARDGQGWAGELGCFEDAHIPGLRRIGEVAHARGALAFTQIFHGGARADGKVSGLQAFSASASTEGPSVREATEPDLARVIAQFADAADRVHRAGQDGVEIHGAHGYLLTQFLSRTENRRSDGWGGALEHRARLIREVTRGVRARVPSPFIVGVRLSPEDFGNAQGLDLDESLTVAGWLAEDGVDFVHLSLWDASLNTRKRPEAHAVPLFRAALPDEVRLLVAGKIWTRADAEQQLARGADAVALARAAIANPDWPRHLDDPAWTPRQPPLSPTELRDRGLSASFVEYMRKWKGFVAP